MGWGNGGSTVMASELHVDAIKHSGGTSALTIDSSGRVFQPSKPMFQVKSVDTNSFGTSHSDSHYDITYRSPLPVFINASRTTEINVGFTIAFASSGGGERLDVTIPVTGVYVLGCRASMTFGVADDFIAIGYMVNSVSSDSSGNLDIPFAGNQSSSSSDANNMQMNFSGSVLRSCTAGEVLTAYQQSSSRGSFIATENPTTFFGYLLG